MNKPEPLKYVVYDWFECNNFLKENTQMNGIVMKFGAFFVTEPISAMIPAWIFGIGTLIWKTMFLSETLGKSKTQLQFKEWDKSFGKSLA